MCGRVLWHGMKEEDEKMLPRFLLSLKRIRYVTQKKEYENV
jgi:hypothetical protein